MKRMILVGLLFALFLGSSSVFAARKLTLHAYPSKVKMLAGTSVRFTAIGKDYEGLAVTPPGMVWMASGGKVNRNGTFKAPKKAGEYVIKVASGRAVAEIKVTVVAPKVPLEKDTRNRRKARRKRK